ncbi:Hsp70 family protein [Streptomyces sp. NPDC051243]|uniref:Hsp70 family protein n=1 Tax=Streptomyces sp. NPDC051243 TaxID=3365646 RepID=UPI00379F8D67
MSGEYPVVAAIDFGTHGSGYAWTVVSEDDREASQRKIWYQDRWPEGGHSAYPKTLSALLLDANGETVAWGHAARREWQELGGNGEREGHTYAAAFKMALAPQHYGGGVVPGLGPVGVDSPGKARSLIVAYLREIFRVALEGIMKSGYHLEDIRWCLTVPAIWDEAQKELMLEAAAEAGLPADGDQLLLAIEPEVAALHCQVHLANVVGADPRRLDVTRADQRFMVVDCGGGTVDITAHRAERGPGGAVRLREIARPLGDRLGSEYVNQAFVRTVLTDRLGDRTIARLCEESEHSLFELVGEWEYWKVMADVEVEPRSGSPRFKRRVSLTVSAELSDMLDEETKRHLEEYPGGSRHRILVEPKEVEAVFDEIVEQILALVDQQLDEMRRTVGESSEPEQILLVGGMARSDYLRHRIALHVQGRAQVLTPPDPASAVLFGAVHFAYDPSVIRARRARHTYGCASSMPFEKGWDPEAKRFEDDSGETLCAERFSVFVTNNQEVEAGETVERVFHPTKRDQSSLLFGLYRTREKSPRYVDEPHCKKIGEVEIDISDSMHMLFEDRKILLRMSFGDTHIKVEAINLRTNRTTSTDVRFHSVY